MRLVSFDCGDGPSWGVLDGESIANVGSALRERLPNLRAVLEAEAYAVVADAIPKADRVDAALARWMPVIPDAGKIFCVGHNYETHRVETGRDKVAHPSIFLRFADTLTGHDQEMVAPSESTMFDYEGELAVVIGKAGRRIPREAALLHVAGYACFNDGSVRDWQWHTQQFTPGKNFPRTAGFGPFLVTADEVGDPADLQVTTRLNGEVVQDQPTSDMIFDVPTIIAYLSTFTALAPGDVICTGTPGGVGGKREPPRWLAPGDVVEVDIPRVGRLRNRIAAECQAARA